MNGYEQGELTKFSYSWMLSTIETNGDLLHRQVGAQTLCKQLDEIVLAKQRLWIEQPIFDHRIGTGLALTEHLTPPEAAQADADEVRERAMPFPDDSCVDWNWEREWLCSILNEEVSILNVEIKRFWRPSVNGIGINWINCGDKAISRVDLDKFRFETFDDGP